MEKLFKLSNIGKFIIFIFLFMLIAVPNNAFATTSTSTNQSKTISRIDDINGVLIKGYTYELPSTLTAVMSDGSTQKVAVVWQASKNNNSKADKYIFTGTVQGYSRTIIATVYKKNIQSIADISATVKQGDRYTLPSKVTAVLNDNSSQQLAVTWNPSNVDTSKPGNYTFKGTVKGYDKKVTLTLIVEENIKITIIGEGRVDKEDKGNLNYSLTAVPAEGWQFDHWEGDVSGSNNPVIVKADREKNVKAVFVFKSIEGVVVSGSTAQPLNQVSLKVREGNNNRTGDVVTSTTTDSNGSYALYSSKPGYYTIEISKDGYVTSYETVQVNNGTKITLNFSILPVVSDSNYRIKLSWAETPRDLDLHLIKPDNEEVYFGHKVSNDGNVKLDVDVTWGFGPETISVNEQTSGVYKVYVHNWSGSPSITASSAKMEIFKGNDLVKTINVPTSGDGYIWNVFKLEGDSIKEINTIE